MPINSTGGKRTEPNAGHLGHPADNKSTFYRPRPIEAIGVLCCTGSVVAAMLFLCRGYLSVCQ